MLQKTFSTAFSWMKMCSITVTSKWAAWRLKSPASEVFAQSFVKAYIKEYKSLHHWPLWGESTGDRWIPLREVSVTRFHLMTSSCIWNTSKKDSNPFILHCKFLVWWQRGKGIEPISRNILVYLFIFSFLRGGGGDWGWAEVLIQLENYSRITMWNTCIYSAMR